MAPNVGLGTSTPDSRGWILYILSVVMVVVAGLFVGVRIGTTAARKHLGMDDWTILASLVRLVDLTCLQYALWYEADTRSTGRYLRFFYPSRRSKVQYFTLERKW